MRRTLTITLAFLAAIGLTTAILAQPADPPPDADAKPERDFALPDPPRPPVPPPWTNRGDRDGWEGRRFAMPGPSAPFGFRGGPPGPPPMVRGERDPFGELMPVDGELRRAAGELHPFWRNDKVREEGNLTDEQVEKLDDAYNETRSKLIDLAAELAHNRIALEDANRAEEPDLNSINKAIEKLGETRIELEKTLAAYRYSVHQALTPEQREQLKKLRETMAERRVRAMAPERMDEFRKGMDEFRERMQDFRKEMRGLPEEQRREIREEMRERRNEQMTGERPAPRRDRDRPSRPADRRGDKV